MNACLGKSYTTKSSNHEGRKGQAYKGGCCDGTYPQGPIGQSEHHLPHTAPDFKHWFGAISLVCLAYHVSQ